MKIRTLIKFILSFFKIDWQLSDYPIIIKKYEVKEGEQLPSNRFKPIPVSIMLDKWFQMSGNGDTEQEAMANLEEKFAEYKKENTQLPRPGTSVPIEFASTEGITNHQDDVMDFIQKILDMDPQSVFVSDQSSLWDFDTGDSLEPYFKKIKKIYNVDVSDIENGNILEIVKKINKINL